MDGGHFRILAVFFFAACALLIGVSTYYTSVMRKDVREVLPKTRRNWLLVEIALPSLHGFHFPDSQTRKKYYFSSVAAALCFFLGMCLWYN